MTTFVEFIDITGADAGRAPYVSGDVRLYYLTGSDGIEETQAQISAAKAAGMTVILIDQTESLTAFGSVTSYAGEDGQIADIENGAGTPVTFEQAVLKRQKYGIISTCYTSYSNLAAVKAALPTTVDQSLIMYGVANYGWSVAKAQQLLDQNPSWGYVQFGDPQSNPNTEVPGTSVTLSEANADINTGKTSWVSAIITVPAPSEGYTVPTLPEIAAGSTDAEAVATIQGLIKARIAVHPDGWGTQMSVINLGTTGPEHDGIDGSAGPLFTTAIKTIQKAAGFSEADQDGIVGSQTYSVLLGAS